MNSPKNKKPTSQLHSIETTAEDEEMTTSPTNPSSSNKNLYIEVPKSERN